MGKKETKEQIVSNLKEKLEKSAIAAITDYKGFTVSEITDLRKRLRENKLKVYLKDHQVYLLVMVIQALVQKHWLSLLKKLKKEK
ncbi:MAG: 50S ribosomal protein L10 [Candidatus Melainabacteria bacterium]|nr:50S ribosomal protein L10 [Candidatus Melainabacteria bacterium]